MGALPVDGIDLDSFGILSLCSSDLGYTLSICWRHSVVEYRLVWCCKSRVRSVVVDNICSGTVVILQFVGHLLVEMCRDDDCDSLFLLDGDSANQYTPMVLDARDIECINIGYGTG